MPDDDDRAETVEPDKDEELLLVALEQLVFEFQQRLYAADYAAIWISLDPNEEEG